MNALPFTFAGSAFHALPSGALFWPDEAALILSDLHLGKAARLSAVGGAALPPYETRATLAKLDADLVATGAARVICLGDSFDASGVEAALPQDDLLWLARMQAGRAWDWVEGNHDPGPLSIGGKHRATLTLRGIVLRHIPGRDATPHMGGHFHPKARINARGRQIARPCFLYDGTRLVLPAYGVYAGGLWTDSPTLSRLMDPGARAILTGPKPIAIPMPRRAEA